MKDPGNRTDQPEWLTELFSNQIAAWPEAAPMLKAWQQGMEQWGALWTEALQSSDLTNSTASRTDRRFTGEAWQKDPRYAHLSQAYLQFAAMTHSALEAAPMDKRSKAQWDFVLRQVNDAISPANGLITNPEVIQEAIDSGGTSLVEGARLFLADVAKGKISMTDETAFEVGHNIATTPGEVVFENELIQLIQYAPSTAEVHKRPLVIVPPCINKYYILDLQPKNSLVAYAVAEGHTVFLVSWRNVGAAQAHLGWDDYVSVARQRPDLALRGQRLPQGQGASSLRLAVLEWRRHESARADVLLVSAQHVSREPPLRAGWHDAMWRSGRSVADQGACLRLCLA